MAKLFLPASDTKTSMFLRPLLELEMCTHSPAYLGTYLGDAHRDTDETAWGSKLYVAFRGEVAKMFDQYLRASSRFVEAYSPKDGDTLYVFTVSETELEKVVKPFMAGKYSKIDRDYVVRHFPNDPGHRYYGNRLVLDKSPVLRKLIERELDATLPKGAEVWSKPDLKKEVYAYEMTAGVIPEA